MRLRRFVLGAVASLALIDVLAVAETENASGFSLVAGYDRPGLPVPKWQFHIAPSGRVEYTSEHAESALGPPNNPVVFTLSPEGGAKLRKLLDSSHGMKPCETRTKGLARMGMKSLEYQSDEQPTVQCTFNFTDNKPLSSAADYLLAVSFTIEQGAVLDHLHRYDRLGLDPVMTQLATAAKEGRAQELQSIRPTLESLAADDQVLERVRQKAAMLLALTRTP